MRQVGSTSVRLERWSHRLESVFQPVHTKVLEVAVGADGQAHTIHRRAQSASSRATLAYTSALLCDASYQPNFFFKADAIVQSVPAT